VADLLAGRIQVWIGAANSLLPHIRAGKLRLLGTAASQRFGEVPEVPTVAEAGVPGFSLYPWIGLFVPAKTPPDVIAKVNAEVNRILGLPDVRARLVPQGIDLSTGSPEDLARLIREDHARWSTVIRAAGVKPE
jgi:tripartite-type tricarboxylate transporter receptor subunit TctC